jgi:hypothetical protein
VAKSPLRYKRLIKELPLHEHAQDALMASGFSENTAKHQSKRVLSAALKHTAEELLKPETRAPMTGKQLMTEIVGLSSADVMARLKHIATQDKDLHSALKVLSVLAKEHGVSLDDSENRVVVPILNIVVDKPDSEPVLIAQEMAQ